MQMGRTWTLLIVAQVGLTVALLPTAISYDLVLEDHILARQGKKR
mgnify:CR=1 FL=1